MYITKTAHIHGLSQISLIFTLIRQNKSKHLEKSLGVHVKSMDCIAPLSMAFSMQEYWSGLPFLSPGDLPDSGIEPRSSVLQAASLLSEPPGKPQVSRSQTCKKKLKKKKNWLPFLQA